MIDLEASHVRPTNSPGRPVGGHALRTAQNAVPNPGALIDHAVQGIARNSLVASNLVASFRPFQPPAPPASSTKCAVPLLEVPIAPDKNIVITEVNPPKEFTGHIVVTSGHTSLSEPQAIATLYAQSLTASIEGLYNQ
jgi:hypothetical protein